MGAPDINNTCNKVTNSEETLFDLIKRRSDDESQRYKDLEGKAGNLIGYSSVVTSLVTGLVTFNIKDRLLESDYSFIYIGSVILMIISIITSIISIKLRDYQTAPSINEIMTSDLEQSEKLKISKSAIMVSTINNKITNDSKLIWIRISWFSLIIGIILFVFYSFIFLYNDYYKTEEDIITSPSLGSILNLFPNIDNKTINNLFPSYTDDRNSIYKYKAVTLDYPNTTRPWMEIDYQWLKENLNIYIVIRSNSEAELKDIATEAIKKWTDLLKQGSKNSSTWNFNIMYVDKDNIFEYKNTPADIVVVLEDEPNFTKCINSYGYSDPFHYDDDPQYAIIYTSCGSIQPSKEDVYTTILHEFGHTLGLGHAYNKDMDLMCSRDNHNVKTCVILSNKFAEPSDLNIDTLLYIYGNDGFGGFNRALEDPIFISSKNYTNNIGKK